MKELVLASSNPHKIEEIYAILKTLDYKILSMKAVGLDDMEIIEDGDTFEANSLIKAKTVYEATKMPAIGDDSGLMVDYLGGEPGVFSARYSGEDKNYQANNEKLLRNLEGVPKEKRGAKFVTVITLMFSPEDIVVARGEVHGYIGETLKGDNGFGYDPLFVVPEKNKTFAELSSEEKNQISHRANALIKLQAMLKERG
jgi:XTP/dITP diphosphohydrolase